MRLFPVVCIGYFGNNVYPARAGEVIRAFVLRRNEGVSVSASLATIIVERVFDGLVMLLFVFFALPFVGAEHIPPIYRVTVIVVSIALLRGAAGLLLDGVRPAPGDAVSIASSPTGWCPRASGRRWMASTIAS